MIYFDELSAAKEMEERQSFKNGYTKTELFMYAKYLKYKKLVADGIDYETVTTDQLKKYDEIVAIELRAFCERVCFDFNYTTKYQDIDSAVESANHYKLKLPLPLPITQKEWDTIKSVPNEKYQKMLFIMLVDAKYYRYFNTSVKDKPEVDEDTVFYIRMPRSTIQREAKVKYENDRERIFFLGCLNKLGIFDISENKLRSWYLKCVDISDDNIIEYITDYAHLTLYFEKLNGGRIGSCVKCGKLFRQNKYGNRIYCSEHQKRAKKVVPLVRTCTECGNTFNITSRTKRTLCGDCYKKYRSMKKSSYRNKPGELNN